MRHCDCGEFTWEDATHMPLGILKTGQDGNILTAVGGAVWEKELPTVRANELPLSPRIDDEGIREFAGVRA